LAQPLVSRIGASPVWRAGLASVFILGLAGFAAGVIPQACRSGVVICKASAPEPIPADIVLPAETSAPSAAPSLEPVADVAPAPDATAIDTMIKQQPAALTRNDLIAQTFAALDPEFTAPSGELTARKVRTVSIGPDGMPVIEGAQPAATEAPAPVESVAEEEPPPEEASAPVQVAEAEEPEPEPVVADEPPVEEDATAAAYAPVRGGDAVIGRQGANVRSAPKTRGSSVLFALAPGEDVTVTQTSNGWSKVVDKSGRSGWVWNQLLRR
jgi:hypothetical protein